jgi:hypothetical protein
MHGVRYELEEIRTTPDELVDGEGSARVVKDNAMNYRNEKGAAGKGLLLWLIGLPLPLILILWLLGVFH